MATMNFSIPDDVKDAFNEAFAGKNKSAIAAEYLLRAVHEQRRLEKDLNFLERIRDRHIRSDKSYSTNELRKVREDGRP